MSYILAVIMGTLAIAGMYQHSDWRYWMGAWGVCALFILAGHVGRFVHLMEENAKREAERRTKYVMDGIKKWKEQKDAKLQ